jgi:hypothetical protein
MKEMRGICFLFSETGTEGGWWAIQEDGFATEGENEGEQWSYGGLRILGEGDDFTVYGDDDSVLFCFSTASFIETPKPGQFRAAKAMPLPAFRGNNRLSAACGYIGFKRTWIRRLGANCSSGKSVAY